MRSRKLIDLDRRLWALRMQYLPRRFSPTGQYQAQEIEGAAIFRMLVGAELESYFEAVATERLEEAERDIAESGFSQIIVALCMSYDSARMGAMPTTFGEIKPKRFQERMQKAVLVAHTQRVKNNQGFKSYNILSLLVPLGMDESLIPEELLTDLDVFAGRRGDVAHNRLAALTRIPDPKDDKDIVLRILKNLAEFERVCL